MWGAQPDADWADHYIPLSWMTLGLDYKLWGMNPFGYHLTNVLIHTANAVLSICWQSLFSRSPFRPRPIRHCARELSLGRCFLVCIRYAWNRWRGSPSGGTCCRDCSGCWRCWLTFTRTIRAARRGANTIGLSFVSFVLAILSKEIALTLPAALAAPRRVSAATVAPSAGLRRTSLWLVPGQARGLRYGIDGRIRRVWLEKTSFLGRQPRTASGMMRSQVNPDGHFDAMAGLGCLPVFRQRSTIWRFIFGKPWLRLICHRCIHMTPHKIDPMAAPFAISLMAVLSITVPPYFCAKVPGPPAVWLAYVLILYRRYSD